MQDCNQWETKARQEVKEHFYTPLLPSLSLQVQFLKLPKVTVARFSCFFPSLREGTSGSKPSPSRPCIPGSRPLISWLPSLEPLFDRGIVSIVAKLSPISFPLKNSYFSPFLPWLTYPSRPSFSRTSPPPSSLIPSDLHTNVYLKECRLVLQTRVQNTLSEIDVHSVTLTGKEVFSSS